MGYLGRYEDGFHRLQENPREYLREDAETAKVFQRPASVTGVFFGYLECPQRKFVAVRAQFEDIDVILQTRVTLDPPRHTDGKGFGPKSSLFGDESASRLLADMIAANPTAAVPLRQITERLDLLGPGS